MGCGSGASACSLASGPPNVRGEPELGTVAALSPLNLPASLCGVHHIVLQTEKLRLRKPESLVLCHRAGLRTQVSVQSSDYTPPLTFMGTCATVGPH